jgi:3-methyladenine DNA glycosylase AlkD
MDVSSLRAELLRVADPEQATILSRFFKTGVGQYGEGDIFLGIKVPVIRSIAKGYACLSLEEVEGLLSDSHHEVRFAALTILIEKYKKGDRLQRSSVFDLYIRNIRRNINNWDLVDLSCPQIVGDYLKDKDRSILYRLSSSDNLWEKRVSIISTLTFIRNNDFRDTLEISKSLLGDKHDLIHKAVGWMLREVGKRDMSVERDFLYQYYREMPRTALRYAIEKMDNGERKSFLAK